MRLYVFFLVYRVRGEERRHRQSAIPFREDAGAMDAGNAVHCILHCCVCSLPVSMLEESARELALGRLLRSLLLMLYDSRPQCTSGGCYCAPKGEGYFAQRGTVREGEPEISSPSTVDFRIYIQLNQHVLETHDTARWRHLHDEGEIIARATTPACR